MKSLLFLSVIFLSLLSSAETLHISCVEESNLGGTGRMGIVIEKRNGLNGSILLNIQRATWYYQFSSADLICAKDYLKLKGDEEIRCVGYNSAGGLNEIILQLTDGNGPATVRLFDEGADQNIYKDAMDGLKLKCELK